MECLATRLARGFAALVLVGTLGACGDPNLATAWVRNDAARAVIVHAVRSDGSQSVWITVPPNTEGRLMQVGAGYPGHIVVFSVECTQIGKIDWNDFVDAAFTIDSALVPHQAKLPARRTDEKPIVGTSQALC